MSEIALGSTSESTRSRRSPRLLIIVLVAMGTIGYLIYTSISANSMYFLTVGELQQKGASVYGEQVRVYGKVTPGTPKYEDGGLLRFNARADGAEMKVVYDGVVPDIFKDDVEVIVTGRYNANGVFEADELLAKCPSKFESAGETAGAR